jgi:hypothetical protein
VVPLSGTDIGSPITSSPSLVPNENVALFTTVSEVTPGIDNTNVAEPR